MSKTKVYNYEKLKKEALKDEEFRKEYDNLEEEFSLAREIIQLRKNNNMTQKELAEKAGTSQPAIARLESGNYKNVSLSFLRRVASALNAVPEIHFKKRA